MAFKIGLLLALDPIKKANILQMFDKFRAVCRVSVEYSTNKLFTLNFHSSVTKVSCKGGRLDGVTKGTLDIQTTSLFGL